MGVPISVPQVQAKINSRTVVPINLSQLKNQALNDTNSSLMNDSIYMESSKKTTPRMSLVKVKQLSSRSRKKNKSKFQRNTMEKLH